MTAQEFEGLSPDRRAVFQELAYAALAASKLELNLFASLLTVRPGRVLRGDALHKIPEKLLPNVVEATLCLSASADERLAVISQMQTETLNVP